MCSNLPPDVPFHNFEALQSVARRSLATQNSSIHWFRGSMIGKGLVGLPYPTRPIFWFYICRLSQWISFRDLINLPGSCCNSTLLLTCIFTQISWAILKTTVWTNWSQEKQFGNFRPTHFETAGSTTTTVQCRLFLKTADCQEARCYWSIHPASLTS